MADLHPPRRYRVMSVRAILLSIVAFAVCLGWWVNRSRNQMAVVATLSTPPYSSNIIYDDSTDYWPEEISTGDRLRRKFISWLPDSLKSILPKDYFHNLLAISFSKQVTPNSGGNDDLFRKIACARSLDQVCADIPVSDADVMHLAGLPSLKRLILRVDSPSLSDESLKSVAGMPRLKMLEISNAMISDSGLAHLKEMSNLESMLLGEARPFSSESNRISITGVGFAHLAALPSLTRLELSSSTLVGEGLKQIATLKHLKSLKLKGTSITDEDLRFLAPLSGLESLEIVGSSIEGTGFKYLTGLTKINYICLEGANVTDAAVPFLANLPALESVMIYGTRVTASGLEGFRGSSRLKQMGLIPAVIGDTKRLKKALPKCNVLNGGAGL